MGWITSKLDKSLFNDYSSIESINLFVIPALLSLPALLWLPALLR